MEKFLKKTKTLMLLVSIFSFASCGDLGTFSSNADFCDGYSAPADSQYVFPFKVNSTFEVGQGNCGTLTHYGMFRYAYDIILNIGDGIHAARAGTVKDLVESNGNAEGYLFSDMNYVSIEHDDGTIGNYLHLDKNGVLVSKGQQVAQGQLIAKGGSSGTAIPHLHFQVFSDSTLTRTVPITFKNLNDNDAGPKPWTKYTAKPFKNTESYIIEPTHGSSHKIYVSDTSNCIVDGANLSSSAPSTTNMTEITAEQYIAIASSNDSSAVFECTYAGAALNAQMTLVGFYVDEFNFDGYEYMQLQWEGAAGAYNSACEESTTLVAGGGASPPYNHIQVYRYNGGSNSSWVDVSIIGITARNGSNEISDIQAYKYTDGKVWFRIIGGNPGVLNRCSSINFEYLRLVLKP